MVAVDLDDGVNDYAAHEKWVWEARTSHSVIVLPMRLIFLQ